MQWQGGYCTIRDKRKLEHIKLAESLPDGPLSTGFADIHLLHDPLPEMALEEVDLGIQFAGKDLSVPILINAITGGTGQAVRINHALAVLAEKYGLALAVGSQTIALEDPGRRDSFSVVRDANPGGLVIANISARAPVEDALQAVEMVQADALQLHLNVPQELAMWEGDRDFRGILKNIRQITRHCPVPVIAKEVGFGLSREAAGRLHAEGVKILDVGGAGGTNFISIEDRRGGLFNRELDDWGIPTAISLAEVAASGLPVEIIATGGIRTAPDAAKALAMGATMVAMSGSILKLLLRDGYEVLDQQVGAFLYRLRAVFLMCGARNCQEIRQKPLIIRGDTARWLESRGIDPRRWGRRG